MQVLATTKISKIDTQPLGMKASNSVHSTGPNFLAFLIKGHVLDIDCSQRNPQKQLSLSPNEI